MSDPLSNGDTLIFDLPPRTIKVVVEGDTYILRSASHGSVAQFRNLIAKDASFSTDGKLLSIPKQADAEIYLVSQNLYRAGANSELRYLPNSRIPDPQYLVNDKQLRYWQTEITSKIYDTLRKISNMNVEETEESLTKEVEELQKRLEGMREKRMRGTEGNWSEGSPGLTTAS